MYTKLQNKIKRFLFTNDGKEFNQRTIARNLNVSPTAVSKAIKGIEFIKETKDPDSKQKRISINPEKSLNQKRISNLEQLYESNLPKFLESKYPLSTIILFGSFSRGEDTYNSDIDIAIIGNKANNTDLEPFEKILKKIINLNFYDNEAVIDINILESLCNGITLKGGINLGFIKKIQHIPRERHSKKASTRPAKSQIIN